MPYTPIANLSRRGEKIAPFFTIQNAVGVMVGLLIPWLLLAAAPLMIRTGAAVLVALIGYAVTMEWNGMSVVERLLWVARGAIRSALRRDQPIHPNDLPRGATSGTAIALERGGGVRLRGAPTGLPVSWRRDDDGEADGGEDDTHMARDERTQLAA